MTETVTELAAFDLPYTRKAEVRIAEFDSGMKMIRLVFREGKRITQIDLDAEKGLALSDALRDAVEKL